MIVEKAISGKELLFRSDGVSSYDILGRMGASIRFFLSSFSL